MQRILCTIFERAPSLPGRLFLPASVVAVLLWGALAPAGLAAQQPPGAPPPAAPRSAPPAARPTGPSGLDLYVFVKKLSRINARPETAFRPAQAEKLYDLLEPLYERPELEPREIRTLLADARRALTPAQTAALDAIQDITPQSVMPPAPAAAPGQGPFGPGGPPGGFPGGPGGFPGGRRGGRRGGPPVDPSADPGFNPFYTMSRGGLTDQAGRDLRAVLDALERASPPVTTHPALVALSPSQKINVTTHHYDLARTGWNAKERILTPRTVEKSRFGRWWHMPLDGQVYASPLVVTSMSIAGRTRDIIIAPTENNSVYALDADTGTVLWKQHLARALTDDEYNDCINITPLHGITSTPFIDLDRKEIYVCGLTQAKLKQVYKAWALDLTTGAVKPGWPITLQGRYKGTAFDGGQNTQRGALTMVDGWIYIPFASRCDIGEWRGWVIGVDTRNPSASQRVFSPSPDAAGSGIWGAAGLAVDRAGNLFAVTGNGTFTLQDGGYSLTDAIVRLTTTDDLSFSYQPKDFFVPSNYEDLDRRDQDLGGSSAILIDHPGSATPHLVFTGGKDGLIYLVDRDNLGGVGGEIQKQRLFGSENGGYGGSIKTTPAYFEDGQGGQYVFVTGNDQGPGGTQGVVALKLGLDAKKRSQLKPVWSAGRPLFQPGAAVVSSNGNADAIVWVIESNKPDDETGPPGVLHAYDARTGKEIYRSTQREQRDSLGDARKFSAPTVANGRVYCGTVVLLCLAVLAPMGAQRVAAAQQPPSRGRGDAGPNNAAPAKAPGDQDGGNRGRRGRGGRGFGGPGGGPRVFGEVTDVRGNVLQMRTPFDEGLTRVIIADDAQILRDETLTADALKPGTKVMGSGRQVEGTGTPTVPLKVEVQTLSIQDGGMGGGPFGFGFGFGGGPLMRGERAQVFRKQNYAGTISFNAEVKSVNPLVLVDDQGNTLPVIIPSDVDVRQRVARPVKEGDITVGARVMAMGEQTPDGLLNARMVMLMGEGPGGGGRGSLAGTIVGVNGKDVTLRARFGREDVQIEVDPAAKVYLQETLDLDSIQVGDSLSFTGKVINGTAQAPRVLVVQTITSGTEEAPKIDAGRRGGFGGFGGRQAAVTATVKGKVLAFEPLRVQTADGREVTIKVPGQVAYVRYRPMERSALKAGQRVLFGGQSRPGGLLADLIVLNPSLAAGGPGF